MLAEQRGKMAKGNLRGITVLLVEDEPEHREELARCLALQGAAVIEAADGKEGMSLFTAAPPDVVVSDIRMPRMGGLEMTALIKALRPETPVVLITAFADTQTLVNAIELEVAGFVPKPVDAEALVRAVRKSVLPLLQRREIELLRHHATVSLEASVGPSPAMKEVREAVLMVAGSGYSVLLQGETGAGKTYVARLVHEMGGRRGSPFVQVDLGSIPETLLEGELFGVRKGAFTGADRDRPGRFESAKGGTIFLDEVSSLPPSVQAKLLQVVEERRYTPLGGRGSVALDARIVAAVQGDARLAVREKRLREDLFFRLAEVEIVLPPIRERLEDIPWLARRFAAEAADELGRPFSGLSPAAEAFLLRQPWPGNVRELRNVVRRAFLLTSGDVLTEDAIRGAERRAGDRAPGLNPLPVRLPQVPLEELEKLAFTQALLECGGARMKAARLLGLDYTTFRRRLRRFGIDGERGAGKGRAGEP